MFKHSEVSFLPEIPRSPDYEWFGLDAANAAESSPRPALQRSAQSFPSSKPVVATGIRNDLKRNVQPVRPPPRIESIMDVTETSLRRVRTIQLPRPTAIITTKTDPYATPVLNVSLPSPPMSAAPPSSSPVATMLSPLDNRPTSASSFASTGSCANIPYLGTSRPGRTRTDSSASLGSLHYARPTHSRSLSSSSMGSLRSASSNGSMREVFMQQWMKVLDEAEKEVEAATGMAT
ncbi:hypothetical protein BC832DRAFT_568299 [Gaertneriomyces semiglobifer]|nr:hypothetical protein BC832DRAFT_568299 [Gaertneriomyces semiglobifer]